MKFFIIGLGSMGKRRIRNLQALGYESIAGFDPRLDRQEEARTRYGIEVFGDYGRGLAEFNPEVLIISTEPSLHMDYAIPAAAKGLHCFIEASVVEGDRISELANAVNKTGIVVVPSCTMHYFSGPSIIRDLLQTGKLGKLLNFNYITGQFLPDWHPWEDVGDFYVSNRRTGGAREIVSFELTWLNEIFGDPIPLACVKSKVSDINADIDDIYHCLMRYPANLIANITIEVLSRPKATRELHILGSCGRLVLSGDENCLRYIGVGDREWTKIDLSVGTIEDGYINPEEPYISEMADFINAVASKDRHLFPNTLERDAQILALLNKLEELSVK